MNKAYFLKGQTGNAWLDDAWFTLEIDGQPPMLNTIDSLNLLQDSLTRHAREARTKVDFAALRLVRKEIESGSSRYLWAFPRLWDALKLLLFRHGHEGYQPHQKPWLMGKTSALG